MSWSVGGAQVVAPGEKVCGDGFRIVALPDRTLVAVVDGLGHGRLAKEAADAFLAFVDRHAERPVVDLIAAAGRALVATRGAAATLASLGPGLIEVVGVGNVRVLARTRRPFHALPSPGILGATHRLPRVAVSEVEPGDLFAICTDGVGYEARLPEPGRHLSASDLAAALLANTGLRSDDATVVVACVVP